METLKCNNCLEIKPMTVEFFKRGATNRLGFRPQCKECVRKIQIEYRVKNGKSLKEKRIKHYKSIADKLKIWGQKSNANTKKKRTENPNFDKDYRNKNNVRHMTKYRNDPLYKLIHRLRGRISCGIKKKYKNLRSASYLGCSLVELRAYMESKFQPGMTWENHGNYGWHIDHIIPLDSANTEEEAFKLCHYTNLQPLWAKENLSKSNKLTRV